MVCLIVIIFFLMFLVCLLYRKYKRLREYVEEICYFLCVLKYINDLGNKILLDNEGGEIKIVLIIF